MKPPRRKDMKVLKAHVMVPKETAEQATVVDWAKSYGTKLDGIDMLHSIPNGVFFAPMNKFALMAKLKSEGLKPGVSDLFLACARRGFHGLYIEMKRHGDGVLSNDQESWLIRATEEGYKAVVCDRAADAMALIKWYLED